MNREMQKCIRDELASDLEAAGDHPLVPLVRKAARLAASLGEDEYRMLFQYHLDGIGPPDTARVHPLPEETDPGRRRRVVTTIMNDRQTKDGDVFSHSLPLLENLAAKLEEAGGRDCLEKAYEIRDVLDRIRNRVGLFLVEADATLSAGPSSAQQPHTVLPNSKVFIGHGRSDVWRKLKDFLQDRLSLEWTEFDRQPVAGLTVTERLEQMLDESCFAFVIMTGEDVHCDGSIHARENVLHEIGLCQGRLGRQRTIVLLEDGCDEFSNIRGLVQIRFPKDGLMSQSEEIRRVLEREGLLKAGIG
ncbi:MAG TPA: nucleotide-binding protein [Verrucomicrobiae bacterium]|nr:nucleotide-binding protein [Verrucomicrobiae bacterium]